ncbi:hypothetical protein PIROE2DRAFT_7144 [Piromyces sp. E2]|nr:hypothetical protein PIROE2DRAFT_7144 [Piromyces sp. E2]|eukprot:OUM65814.1 hypothetical protein PIROE2DRAFT_7144 [Piromyces sp. E2]
MNSIDYKEFIPLKSLGKKIPLLQWIKDKCFNSESNNPLIKFMFSDLFTIIFTIIMLGGIIGSYFLNTMIWRALTFFVLYSARRNPESELTFNDLKKDYKIKFYLELIGNSFNVKSNVSNNVANSNTLVDNNNTTNTTTTSYSQNNSTTNSSTQ